MRYEKILIKLTYIVMGAFVLLVGTNIAKSNLTPRYPNPRCCNIEFNENDECLYEDDEDFQDMKRLCETLEIEQDDQTEIEKIIDGGLKL